VQIASAHGLKKQKGERTMKRMLQWFIVVVCSVPVLGGVASDGFLTAGEYDHGMITWRSYDPPLIVDGGGQ